VLPSRLTAVTSLSLTHLIRHAPPDLKLYAYDAGSMQYKLYNKYTTTQRCIKYSGLKYKYKYLD